MPDKSYTNGEYIFREGESAAFAYVIKSGVVEIVKNSASGVQVLAELTAPTIFGEMALIDGNPRSAGARAKENTEVTEVTATSFKTYLSKNPEAAIRIMKTISENLRSSNQLVAKYEMSNSLNNKAVSDLVVLDKNIHDFEIDDTDALYDQKVSKPLLILVITLVIFLFGSVLFASLSQVDTTISARGEFLTATPNIVVEASASSVVKSVEVERGDFISKNEIIAYLDDTMVKVNLKQNQEKIDNIIQALISLYMEEYLINNISEFDKNTDIDSIYLKILTKLNLQQESIGFSELYKSTLLKKITEYSQKIKSLDEKLNKTQKEYVSSKKLLDIVKKQTTIKAELASTKEKLYTMQKDKVIIIDEKQIQIKSQLAKISKDLYDKQVGTLLNYQKAQDNLLKAQKSKYNTEKSIANLKLDYLSAKDSLLNAEKDQFNSETDISKLESVIITQKADKQAFIANWTSKLISEITNKNEELIQLKQERIKLTRLVDNIIVRSPAEGIVLDIPAVSSGGIVSEGEPIVTLVQSNQPLFLEIDIDPKQISDIKKGMKVSIKLDSMPFQEFGGLDGELIYFSNDTFNESLSGDKGVFYRGRVKVESLEATKMPADFVLSQGMLASADIMVGKRSLISYFTYPIMKAFEESFNEPE